MKVCFEAVIDRVEELMAVIEVGDHLFDLPLPLIPGEGRDGTKLKICIETEDE